MLLFLKFKELLIDLDWKLLRRKKTFFRKNGLYKNTANFARQKFFFPASCVHASTRNMKIKNVLNN